MCLCVKLNKKKTNNIYNFYGLFVYAPSILRYPTVFFFSGLYYRFSRKMRRTLAGNISDFVEAIAGKIAKLRRKNRDDLRDAGFCSNRFCLQLFG